MSFALDLVFAQCNRPGWESVLDVDICGEEYLTLMKAAIEAGCALSFIVRANQLPAAIPTSWCEICGGNHLILRQTTDCWPGTEMCSHAVGLFVVELTPCHLPFLLQVQRLLDWLPSMMPEDPAFYNRNGELWLYTTTHERMLWFHPEIAPSSALNAIRLAIQQHGPHWTQADFDEQMEFTMSNAKLIFADLNTKSMEDT